MFLEILIIPFTAGVAVEYSEFLLRKGMPV